MLHTSTCASTLSEMIELAPLGQWRSARGDVGETRHEIDQLYRFCRKSQSQILGVGSHCSLALDVIQPFSGSSPS